MLSVAVKHGGHVRFVSLHFTNMNHVINWISFIIYVCGWMGDVKGIQRLHTACQTLHTVHQNKLNIICTIDEAVFVINQLNINSLGKNSSFETARNDTECQNTTSSTCFRSLTSDLPADYMSKINQFCNGKHKCTLEFSHLSSSARIFTNSCQCCTDHFYQIRLGVSFECLPLKSHVLVGENITQTRDGSLYLKSNESGQCLVRGSIESARILEQSNMRFTVSNRKSRLCTEILTNRSLNYNEDLSCLRGVGLFLLDIQTTNALSGKLWIEFKGVSLRLDCRNNIQFPPVQHSELSGGSEILPLIIGIVTGFLLLLALILIVLKRRKAQTIKTKAKHRTIKVTTTLEEQDSTYYSNDAGKSRNDANDLQGTQSSFDDTNYNTVETDCNYAEINIKEKTSETGTHNGEQNVKKERGDTEKSRKESRHSKNVIPRSSKTAGSKPNKIIGEVTGDVYAEVCKKDGSERSRQEPRDTPRSGKTAGSKSNTIIGEVTGDVYAEVCKKDGSERSRQEPRDSENVTPRSGITAESKPNTIIGEVTGDVYASVCKTDDL